MKQLSRIILVNWYLFEANEWEIRGCTALLGKNGAGKSSFLDAVQYLMLPNKRDWNPNAKASDGKKKRNIKSYILGRIQSDDVKLTEASYRPREEALCRMALVFRDDDTGQETTIGAALSARASDESEKVEAYFVLDNHGLRLGDFLKMDGGQNFPKPYSELKAHFQHITRGKDCYLFSQSSRYLEQMLRSLCHPDNIPDPNKYRRTFKKSITLSNIGGSVSDFVKTSVLHSEPINVESMRDSYESFKNKKAEVEKTKTQIERLKRIASIYNSAHSSIELSMAYKWCLGELKFDQLSGQIDNAEDAIESYVNDLQKTKDLFVDVESQLEKEKKNLTDLQIVINNDENITEHNLLKERKNSADDKISKHAETLVAINKYLGKSDLIARTKSIISEPAQAILNDLASHYTDDLSNWPVKPELIDEAIQSANTELVKELATLKNEYRKLVIQAEKEKNLSEELHQQLEAINKGLAPLSRDAQGLLDALCENGFDAVPICQLIEVTDKKWQRSIEAYLKRQTEALLVPVEQAIAAVNCYKNLKHEYYGVQVINTLKVKDWNDEIKPNTAASLIKGSDPLAVKYIQRLLKDVELVESTKDLMNRKRAITPDGMEQGGGSAQRNRLSHLPKLGAPTEQEIKQIAAECQNLYKQWIASKDRASTCESVVSKLALLIDMADTLPSVTDTAKSIKLEQENSSNLARQINAIDASKTEELRNEESILNKRCKSLEEESRQHIAKEATLEANIKTKEDVKKTLTEKLPFINEEREAIAKERYFNNEKSASTFDKLTESFDLSSDSVYEKALQETEKRQQSNYKAYIHHESQADGELEKFNQEYGIEGVDINLMEAPDLGKKKLSTVETLYKLESIGLHKREEAAADALQQARRAFREEVTTKLNVQIKEMERRFRELNNELRKRPFTSGVIYKFKYDRKTEFRDFLNYVERITNESVANRDGLFDTEGEEALKVIEEIIEGNLADELLDYRNYYLYDILILNPDGSEESFTSKKGDGSGGEQSTPFYVAMGASLASVYRIQTKDDALIGGMSIYLADEAFDKLSRDNALATADYLKSIGLQLFLAAPDIRVLDFAHFCETTLFFTRYGGDIEVETVFTKEKFRQLLASEYEINEEEVLQRSAAS